MKTYTFHVSVPGTGRVWRKIEVAGSQTLQDLHLAIQDAYDFDNDHMYSFFMSGRAWDRASEYTLPEGADPWGFVEDDKDDEFDEEEEDDQDLMPEPEKVQALQEMLGDAPPPQSIGEMLALLDSNPELRAQLVDMLVEAAGIPRYVMDQALSQASSLMAVLSDDELASMFAEDEPAGDVFTTTVDSLDLAVGKEFMYLFDYGDEWRFKVRVHGVQEDADPAIEYPRVVESVGEAPPQYLDWDDEEDWDDEAEDWDDEEEWDDEDGLSA